MRKVISIAIILLLMPALALCEDLDKGVDLKTRRQYDDAPRPDENNLQKKINFAKYLQEVNRTKEAIAAAISVYELAEDENLISEAEKILKKSKAEIKAREDNTLTEKNVQIIIVPLGNPNPRIIREIKILLEQKMGIKFVIHPVTKDMGRPDRTYASIFVKDCIEEIRQKLGEAQFSKVKNELGFQDHLLNSQEGKLKFIYALLSRSGETATEARNRFNRLLDESDRHKQYDNSRLLKEITKEHPLYRDSAIKGFLFITDKDIFEGNERFRFGGTIPGYGIISYHRFTSAFNLETQNRPRLISRTLKQALSSANFIFNIPRCENNECARAYPRSLAEHDHKTTDLCAVCLERLNQYIKKSLNEYGEKPNWGLVMEVTAYAYWKMNNMPEALSHNNQALQIWRDIGDQKHRAMALVLFSDIYRSQNLHDKATPYDEEALKAYQELDDIKGQVGCLLRLGIGHWKRGNSTKALSYFEQAQKIFIKTNNRKGIGETAMLMGLIYWSAGEYTKALSHYKQSLEVCKEFGNMGIESSVLVNTGLVYRDLGDYTKALDYYEQSAIVARGNKNKHGEGYALLEIGVVHSTLGNYQKALEYFEQALKFYEESGSHIGEIETHIGEVHLNQGIDLDKALEIFTRLNSPILLGRYYLSVHDYRKALAEFPRSLNHEESKEIPNTNYLLAGYIGMGLACEGLTDYAKAKSYFEKGIGVIEKLRGKLDTSEREKYLEAKADGFPIMEPYHGMIRILLKEKGVGNLKKAFSYAERAKSKTFVEMLAARELKGKSVEDKNIIEKEKMLQKELLSLRKQIEFADNVDARQRLKNEFDKKESAYERFIHEVKLKNSELASLISINPLKAEDIQAMLDSNTTLVEYYNTRNTLYAWLITKNDVRIYEMPVAEKNLQEKVDALTVPNMSNRPRKRASVVIYTPNSETRSISIKERDKNRRNFSDVTKLLYRDIIGPIAKDIKTHNLIIVPHGYLHKVPFAALTDGGKYLIDEFSVTMLPSAGIMEHIIKKRKPNRESMVVFANPKTDYTPLEFAEVEGESIKTIFPKSSLYMREKATESLAKTNSYNFNIIHFATHGEFNERQPLQSGLILAKDADNDGFLQVHEIFGLDLKNANMVTLSACETALAQVQGGDDLVGLSRGFIYAGTPSLLATLWEVDDRSTSILMGNFYRNWKKGMSKADALRKAQISLKEIEQYSHPFYWAPFIMIGDWR